MKAYCVSQGWASFKFYVDEGKSAKDTHRPSLELLLRHIEQGIIDTVLVYRLDRLTRSVRDLYTLLDYFDKYNAVFALPQKYMIQGPQLADYLSL